MKLLPSRYICCAVEIVTAIRAFGDLIPSSQSAALWLYAWPGLLGWKRRVNWLFFAGFDLSTKSRNTLWGIDSAGYVIIVEIETSRSAVLRDPFRRFVSHYKARGDSRSCSTRELRARWRESFRSEQKLADEQSTYKRNVEKAFVKRRAGGNPPPIFVVVVGSRRCEFSLSDEGFKNWLFLEKLAGSSRVALRAINGRFGLTQLRVHCWSPRPLRASSRKWRRLR